MYEVDVGAALAEGLFKLVFISLIYTIFGAAALKYFARQIPVFRLALIFYWAIFRVILVIAAGTLVLGALGVVEWGLLGTFVTLVGLGVTAWLITRHMHTHYGFPDTFPSIGAKAVTVATLAVWLIAISFFGLMYLLAR